MDFKETKIFIFTFATIAIALDIYWATNAVYGDTISEITRSYSTKWATIPVAYGILTGHLFWHHRGAIQHWGCRIVGLATIAILTLLADYFDLCDAMPIIFIIPSIALGRLLWPQPVSKDSFIFINKHKGDDNDTD